MTHRLRFAGLCVAVTAALGPLAASEKKAATVEGCVSVRRMVADEVRLSPDGTTVAYLVRSPNVIDNQTSYQIWVRTVSDTLRTDNGILVFSSTEELSGLRWLAQGKRVALLQNARKAGSRLLLVDVAIRTTETIADVPAGIQDYSIDAAGETVAYTTYMPEPHVASPNANAIIAARGFHIPFATYSLMLGREKTGYTERRDVWGLRKQNREKWERSEVPSPQESAPGFRSAMGLSLSPDGKYLAFEYQPDNTPEAWSQSCVAVNYRKSYGDNALVVGLYDTATRRLSAPLDLPSAFFPIRWSADSGAFALPAASPVGSAWEKADCEASRGLNDFHVFAYDIRERRVSEVLAKATPRDSFDVISWPSVNDDMLAEIKKQNAIARLRRAGTEWQAVSQVDWTPEWNLSSITTADGETLVGIRQASTIPPDLARYDVKSNNQAILTDLNPEIRDTSLGEVEKVEWMNRYGGRISGNLIKPVGYQAGRKYPLAIMLTWPNNEFVCDGYYETAFAPQPLANNGFLVLIFNVYDVTTEGSRQPEGPPAIREAETMVASIEAGVEKLAALGLADPANVGLIGFSRSSWKVDYMLTHSKLKLAAASSADSGIYNYGSFWLFDGWPGDPIIAGYGGPPFGGTRENWLRGAPALNADRVRTPVLMEYTGHSSREEPVAAYEFYTALQRLGKPVELFFYPKGNHPLDTPFERVASLQRNVDWFRFWMQGYEGKPPAYDPDQYVRWRELREQQRWNERVQAEGKDPSAEFVRQTLSDTVVGDAERAPATKELAHAH